MCANENNSQIFILIAMIKFKESFRIPQTWINICKNLLLTTPMIRLPESDTGNMHMKFGIKMPQQIQVMLWNSGIYRQIEEWTAGQTQTRGPFY